MQTKILIIGVVKKGNTILLQKKPDGSPPYKQTWYLFGGELTPEITPEEAIISQLKSQAGIDIRVVKRVGWGLEIKNDIDGIKKQFIYLDTICEYISGELIPAEGIEKLEWAPIDKLSEYDHVPPSKLLLTKLGFLI